MTKMLTCGLAVAVLALSVVSAQQVAPTNVPGGLSDTAAPSNAIPRDPFWPVGYAPKDPEHADPGTGNAGPVITEEDWRQAQKRMVTSSVFKSKDAATGSDRFLALINGKVVTPGDTVTVKYRDFTFRFRVTNIASSGPQFERIEQK